MKGVTGECNVLCRVCVWEGEGGVTCVHELFSMDAVCVHMSVYALASAGGQHHVLPSSLETFIYDLSLRPSLSPNLKRINLARLNDFRDLRASAHLVLRLPAHATTPDFYMGSGYTNQDLQALVLKRYQFSISDSILMIPPNSDHFPKAYL